MNRRDLPADITRRVALRALAASGAIAALPGTALAQTYPNRPVRFVVGSPPGALGDVATRLLARKLQDVMGQPFVVDNRPGAAGNIAADAVAKSAADGYTMLFAPDLLFSVYPTVYSKLPYSPSRDLAPVSVLNFVSHAVIVNPGIGANTVPELVALLRARPGTLRFGSGGVGHPTHLYSELMLNRLGVTMEHVPYKGTPPAVQAVLTNEVSLMIVGLAEILSHLKSGGVKVLATTGPDVSDVLPGVPALKTFHADLDMNTWGGAFVPAGTPKDAITALNTALRKVLTDAELRKQFGDIGLTAYPTTPEEVLTMIQGDSGKYVPLAKSLNLKLD